MCFVQYCGLYTVQFYCCSRISILKHKIKIDSIKTLLYGMNASFYHTMNVINVINDDVNDVTKHHTTTPITLQSISTRISTYTSETSP